MDTTTDSDLLAAPQTLTESAVADREEHAGVQTRLHGNALLLARMACGAGALLGVSLFSIGLLVRFAHLGALTSFDVPPGWSWTPEVLGAVLAQLGLSVGFYQVITIACDLVFALCFFSVAVLLAWRAYTERMALLVALFLLIFGGVQPTYGYRDALISQYPTLSWLFGVGSLLSWGLLLAFFFLYPDGRFVPHWIRWWWVALVVGQGLSLFFPPLHTVPIQLLAFVSYLASALLAQVYRYQHSAHLLQRQQIKWAVFGFSATFSVFLGYVVLGAVFPALWQPGVAGGLYLLADVALGPLMFLPIPMCVGVALLRYRLWDIDLLINRTLVYGLLTAIVIGVYVLLVGALGTLFQAYGGSLIAFLATGVVAVLFQPLRVRLQRGVNRLLYGQRDEPYAVLSRLGQRLEATLAPDAVLPAVVETVAQALKLPYAAVSLKQSEGFRVAAAHGPLMGTPLSLPLAYQGEVIGQLLMTPRRPGEPLTPPDRRLLEDLTRQIEVVAHAIRLNDELQRSRERLVTAREEERRRLRRDLHDGLGPTLAALALKATTVSELIPTDPAAATQLSDELYADIRATVGEIRRLVYALRPPALDDLGLVAALRECAAHYECPDHNQASTASDRASGLRISVEAPDYFPPLPAAVEVAAYRIVQEALTNVVRHAEAQNCTVQVVLAESLQIEVADDGIGFPAERRAGVGLLSMRERAAELGGSCVIESLPGAGVYIRARLPLPKEQADGTLARPDRG